ncbi:hypothetical protein L1987_40007 [Smallanthus sonchifolius]|uniref:Uncharacterized protein n=1 Tax=Smallanthus sonchifolius TaxID=185202 RepID=A0ACB9GTJ8_9ASTR|nr:hypothetical protein L1987_40007 [Smallanthus sonchifolius]
MFTINTTPNVHHLLIITIFEADKMKINLFLVFSLLLLVSYALAVETTTEAKGGTDKVEPAAGGNWGGGGGGNWGGGGGGGGGGCRHGCCYQGRYGCQRCCSSLEEAKAFAEKQVHP